MDDPSLFQLTGHVLGVPRYQQGLARAVQTRLDNTTGNFKAV